MGAIEDRSNDSGGRQHHTKQHIGVNGDEIEKSLSSAMDADNNWTVAPNYNGNMEGKRRMPSNLMGTRMGWVNGMTAEQNDITMMASMMNYPMMGSRMGVTPPNAYSPNMQLTIPPMVNLANPFGISPAGTALSQISHTPILMPPNNALVSSGSNTPESKISLAVERNILSTRQVPNADGNADISNDDSKASTTAEVNTIASSNSLPGAIPNDVANTNTNKEVNGNSALDGPASAPVEKKRVRSKPRKRPSKQATIRGSRCTDKSNASPAKRSRKRTMATRPTAAPAQRKKNKKFNNIKVVDGVESILPALSSPLNIEAFKTHIPLRPHLWHDANDNDDCQNDDNGKKRYKEVGPWEWNDDEEVEFQTVERIHVHRDVETVRKRVTQARITGTPIVLVGHNGWPGFSNRWLRRKQEIKGAEKQAQDKEEGTVDAQLLDLSTCDYEVVIERMSADIGEEMVPTIRKNYDERNPIDKEISVSNFLKDHWSSIPTTEENVLPSSSELATTSTTNLSHASQQEQQNANVIDRKNDNKGLLYLHQWQFPNSKTAVAKLCRCDNDYSNIKADGMRRPVDDGCAPLPHDILGEDLLSHWLDNKINPYQYIFMGGTATNSKLHADLGGLEIFIAPLVGEKECVLVHRDDGDKALYGLSIPHPVDQNVNLHRFPSFRFARIWKTVVGPGEILLMPQGTYHQCRNITPCLSYSRYACQSFDPLIECLCARSR